MKRMNMMLVALFGGAMSLFADILPMAIRCEVEPVSIGQIVCRDVLFRCF